MAWRLAVYASPCQLPGNDARLACGCWLGFAARDSDPQSSKERFQLCVDHITSSSRELAWRNPIFVLFKERDGEYEPYFDAIDAMMRAVRELCVTTNYL